LIGPERDGATVLARRRGHKPNLLPASGDNPPTLANNRVGRMWFYPVLLPTPCHHPQRIPGFPGLVSGELSEPNRCVVLRQQIPGTSCDVGDRGRRLGLLNRLGWMTPRGFESPSPQAGPTREGYGALRASRIALTSNPAMAEGVDDQRLTDLAWLLD
jgi:hypothetical protein